MSGAKGQDLLGGRYRLVEERGSGGMAEVWSARDEVLDRDVAVKVLAPTLPDSEHRQRFRTEAQSIARLSHPNIAAVHDYGETGPVPYLVMELIDGVSLAQHLHEHEALPWREAVVICAEVAAALAAAHARGVVHRDIKPGNVMLTATGAKVVDFGIAGLAGALEQEDPQGRVLGTPTYLAPERLLGDTIVAASDVYALGVLLYRCLTGDLPWHADTPTEMLTNHCYEPPQPLTGVDELPGAVYAVYDACLAKDPAARPDALQVAHVLADAAGVHVALPRDADVLPLRRATASEPEADPPVVAATQRTSLTRAGMIAAGVVIVVAVGAFSAAYLTQRRSPAEAADLRTEGGDPAVGCRVLYELRRAPSGPFNATLTLNNTGERAFRGWTMRFQFTGAERLVSGLGGTWRQAGPEVSLTSDATLSGGQAATVAFTANGPAHAMPAVFTVNDTLCAADTTDLTGSPVPTPLVATAHGTVLFDNETAGPDTRDPSAPGLASGPSLAVTPTGSSDPTASPTPTSDEPRPGRTSRKPTPSHRTGKP